MKTIYTVHSGYDGEVIEICTTKKKMIDAMKFFGRDHFYFMKWTRESENKSFFDAKKI